MAATPTTSWDETSPAGSDALNQGDNSIRLVKTSIREVIAVDHKFGSSGSDVDNGKHNWVSLLAQADIGTGAAGKPILGAQTVAGKGELLFTDVDNNDVQLTSLGKLYLDAGRISNNVWLIARNAANSANVNLIKANASDAVELPDGATLSSAAAPTANAQIANKKYVDDQITSHAQVGMGSWDNTKSFGTIYQASTDGFVVGYWSVDNGDNLQIISDSAAAPTTVRQQYSTGSGTTAATVGFCCPVKKNDYWKAIATSGAVGATSGLFFIPLGS